MLFDRLRALRRTKTMKVLIGGSAVGLALSGVAAAQHGLLGSNDQEENDEGEDVTLDLEGEAVSVPLESSLEDGMTPGEASGLSETAESPVTAEEASPQDEVSPASVDSPASPASVDTPQTPPSPPSPASPDSPPTPESVPSPDSPDDDEDDDD